MDTEKTLDLNKPLFSYSRYERNEYGYGDDFIHRDGDGVDMQVFFNQATGEFVSKGVSISDFTNLVEGKSARATNAWTRHSLDPKELLPDDISKVEIKDMDAEEAEGADTVLAETFNSIDALSTDAAIDLLRVYSNCDASGRDAVAKTFYALSGESFDSYLMTASEVCKKTLGILEPEPPQPAKAINLSQKTASSREASDRLSEEIGAKPCARDEGTVGDS